MFVGNRVMKDEDVTPRKKKVRVVAAAPKFSSVRLLVIANQPSRHQSRWSEIVGSEVRVLQKSQVRRMKDVGDATHIVCDVEWDESFGRVVCDLAQERHVVNYNWLREALNTLDVDELPKESTFGWTRRRVPSDETYKFSKYACQRPTRMNHGNRRIVTFLVDLVSWWEYGTLTDEEDSSYSRRVAIMSKIVSLVKVWPVELDGTTWDAESKKLLGQYHISDSSNSKSGGWISLLEAVSRSARIPRDDAYWCEDPKRRVVRELRMLKCGIGRKVAVDLCEKGVRSAEDLVRRRREMIPDLPETRIRALSYAPVGPSATPMDEKETNMLLDALRKAAPEDHSFDVVGSYRRGKIGGHDLDVLLSPSNDEETSSSEVFNTFVEKLGDLLESEVVEIRGIGHGVATKSSRERRVLSVRHIVLHSPTVPSAFRHVDVVFSPRSNYAHALLGWSGSRNFQRSLREYASRCHQKDWQETGGKEVKGIRGWNLSPNQERLSVVHGRRLERDEHWHWSQSGISICTGASTSKENPIVHVYEEDSSGFQTEKDIFDFFHLDYRSPEERCA